MPDLHEHECRACARWFICICTDDVTRRVCADCLKPILKTMPCGLVEPKTHRRQHIATRTEPDCITFRNWHTDRQRWKLPPNCLERKLQRAAILESIEAGKDTTRGIGIDLRERGYEPLFSYIHGSLYEHMSVRYLDGIVAGSISGMLRCGYLSREWGVGGQWGWRYELTPKAKDFLDSHRARLRQFVGAEESMTTNGGA